MKFASQMTKEIKVDTKGAKPIPTKWKRGKVTHEISEDCVFSKVLADALLKKRKKQ